MADTKKYAPRDYSKVRGLTGISDKQIEEHLKLYEGYVKRCNALTEKLFAICNDGKASGADPVYAELTRRLGFEYSGMVNHEYYFENMIGGAQAEPPAGSKLRKAIETSFGKYETWLADFRAVATMPGIGWAMLFQDPSTGWLSNMPAETSRRPTMARPVASTAPATLLNVRSLIVLKSALL